METIRIVLGCLGVALAVVALLAASCCSRFWGIPRLAPIVTIRRRAPVNSIASGTLSLGVATSESSSTSYSSKSVLCSSLAIAASVFANVLHERTETQDQTDQTTRTTIQCLAWL